MPNINTAIAWAIATANDPSHGYSMTNRYGPDYDCSSFVAAALIAGGFNVPASMTTPVARSYLLTAGFVDVTMSDPMQKGDIYINPASGVNGHMVMAISDSQIVEAQGGDADGQPGDSTGQEIRITALYSFGQTQHMRWPHTSPGRVARWHTKNWGAYSKESLEAQDNAVMIYNALMVRGWGINAVAGLLGNIGWESGYNPWMWEGGTSGDSRINSTDTAALLDYSHGYGLVQFTPSGDYCLSPVAQALPDFGVNYLDIPGNPNDGTAQMQFLDDTHTARYRSTTDYPETYDEYISSTKDADYLAAAWFYNYERGTGSITQRQADALYWQRILPGLIESPVKRMKIIFYLNRRRGRRI